MTSVFDLIRHRPRVMQSLAPAYEQFLTDRAWLNREKGTGGVDEQGRPMESRGQLGPFPAKISPPNTSEQRQLDRWTTERAFILQIASDVRPLESDTVDVLTREGRRRYRVLGGVEERRAAWGENLVWHVPVAATDEY